MMLLNLRLSKLLIKKEFSCEKCFKIVQSWKMMCSLLSEWTRRILYTRLILIKWNRILHHQDTIRTTLGSWKSEEFRFFLAKSEDNLYVRRKPQESGEKRLWKQILINFLFIVEKVKIKVYVIRFVYILISFLVVGESKQNFSSFGIY